MNVFQAVPVILMAYANGDNGEYDKEDKMMKLVETKLIRRGALIRSVSTGKITITDYGMKMLRKMGMVFEA